MRALRCFFVVICALFFYIVDAEASAASGAGSFRKDYYLAKFKEAVEYPIPTDGGRIHVALSNVTCNASITSVKINGQEALNLPSSNPDFSYFDWARVHQDGSNIWISFHSRNTDWFPSSISNDTPPPVIQVDVESSASTCYSEKITTPLQSTDSGTSSPTVTYVTTQSNGSEILVYVFNPNSKQEYVVQDLFINGKPVSSASGSRLEAGQVTIFRMQGTFAPGSLWTVVLRTDADKDNASGWGGRVLPELFPVQVWPQSDDCPIPSVNDDNANEILNLGVNSVFDDSGKCGSPANVADSLADAGVPAYVSIKKKYVDSVKNRTAIASIFIGDEVDGKMDENLRDTTPREAMEAFPELPTYQGAKTNAHVGAYSGITDIQGMDAYVAACAPTIVNVLKALPISYPYDYLKVTRDNHMPLPTWLYSQLYSDAWSYQADAPELVMQFAMTVLAGAKGLTLFQSSHKYFKEHDMKTIKRGLLTISSIGEIFRTGDIGGAIVETSTSKVMVEAVRTPEKLVVIVLNLDASGYSNLLCHTFVDKHWTFKSQTVDKITLTGPSSATFSGGVEQIESDQVSIDGADVRISKNVVELKNIKLDDKDVARFFVFDVSTAMGA